jgi:transposase
MSHFAFPPVPIETADEARSVFNIENVYLLIGDRIEQLIGDLDLSDLDSTGEKQANTLCLLAMITIFQFAENMPDRQAAEALRRRTDWKYALHLSLVYPGLEPTSLCEFRQQLLSNSTGQASFNELLVRLAEIGLFSKRTKNSMDAKSVILEVCAYSRLDWLVQAIGMTLEALATYQPELLREISQPHWYERYNRLPTTLQKFDSAQELASLGAAIGKDAHHLLEAVSSGDHTGNSGLAEVEDLRRIFHQQFDLNGNQVKWQVVCSFCSDKKLDSLQS